MNPDYQKWIAEYIDRTPHLRGQCKPACEEMQRAFPELLITKGHVSTVWGRDQHWWLKTTEGKIIDPTASQYPVVFSYSEHVEGEPVRVGTCMYCGKGLMAHSQKEANFIRSNPPFCNDECASKMEEEF